MRLLALHQIQLRVVIIDPKGRLVKDTGGLGSWRVCRWGGLWSRRGRYLGWASRHSNLLFQARCRHDTGIGQEENKEIEEKQKILDGLDSEIGINRELLQDRTVDPGFGSILIRNALIAIAISLAGILIYVWIRFEFRFGATAIVTLAHDVLITLGVYAILNREINTSTIAAILTIIGYSLNDTIVVFDRIRENTPQSRTMGFDLEPTSMSPATV